MDNPFVPRPEPVIEVPIESLPSHTDVNPYLPYESNTPVPIRKNKYHNILGLLMTGFILGVILMLIIFIVMYMTNTGPFSYCSSSSPECTSSQYFNNPTNALRDGATLSNILFINNNQMMYNRVPREPCAPGSNQTVPITYPQYCSFTSSTGTVQFRDSFFEANIYRNGDEVVRTNGNCVPDDDTYTSGTILLKWDS